MGVTRRVGTGPSLFYRIGNIYTVPVVIFGEQAGDLRRCDLGHPLRPMTDTLGRRIFLSHLELSYRLGRKVTLAEFGAMIAEEMGRPTPFTGAAVSRWESGGQTPTPQIIEAIATLTHMDPGWISHGSRSAAPRPPRLERTLGDGTEATSPVPVLLPSRKKAAPRRRS